MLFEMSKKVEAKVEDTIARLEKVGLPRIPVKSKITSLGRGFAGRAWGSIGLIAVSPDYYKEFPDHIINVTVPHEVVHVYVRKYFPRARQAHGPEFRRLMNILGLEGKTYHNMVLKEGPNRIRKMKTRYIYLTPSGKECYLTKGQHTKVISGYGTFAFQGEKLAYSGKVTQIK